MSIESLTITQLKEEKSRLKKIIAENQSQLSKVSKLFNKRNRAEKGRVNL